MKSFITKVSASAIIATLALTSVAFAETTVSGSASTSASTTINLNREKNLRDARKAAQDALKDAREKDREDREDMNEHRMDNASTTRKASTTEATKLKREEAKIAIKAKLDEKKKENVIKVLDHRISEYSRNIAKLNERITRLEKIAGQISTGGSTGTSTATTTTATSTTATTTATTTTSTATSTTATTTATTTPTATTTTTKARTKSVAAALAALGEAKVKLTHASATLASIKANATTTVSATNPGERLEAVKALFKSVNDDIKDAHKKIADAISSLKGIGYGQLKAKQPESHGTTTASTTATH